EYKINTYVKIFLFSSETKFLFLSENIRPLALTISLRSGMYSLVWCTDCRCHYSASFSVLF
ncbi:hypothetical protein ACMA55_004772, partial [Salmonella enterica subsp. enterica serovar Newport]